MKESLIKIGSTFAKLLSRMENVFDSDDPLMILPYRGYSNEDKFFIKGRVLENEGFFQGKDQSKITALINSYKRFETDEIPNAKIRLNIQGLQFDTTTDEEGYFIFEHEWSDQKPSVETRWINAHFSLIDFIKEDGSPITAEGEVLYPSSTSSIGYISDVDDTVLQTHVTSLLRLKMIYATMAQHSDERLPMEGIVELYKAFVQGKDRRQDNPVFYVSSSPWNLYDLISQFMDIQHLPKGPILLRDYGLRPSGAFFSHKIETISHILNMYPNMSFVMLGDTGGKDADYYIELAEHFPDRITAIYIRQTKDNKNARRIKKLIAEKFNINVVLVEQTHEIEAHARQLGLIQ